MYRLLIVDDEEIIVNGLYEIFNSIENLDLDVYKAYSGEEAIEWLNRTRIDIVLTDIRMPDIDGLRLLDEIHRSWPQCKVIFLTGYNEFEYIYKAMQHNGVSYILKTEDNEKVIQAIKIAIKDIQKETKIEDLVYTAKEQMNMALELFQKDYFVHLLHNDTTLSIEKSQFEQLAIPMQPEYPVVLLIGNVNNITPNLSYWDKIQFLYSIRLIIVRKLSTHVRSFIIMDENYRFVLLIQPKELLVLSHSLIKKTACYDKVISFLKGTLEVIQSVCRESLNTSISFALSGEPCDWTDISQKYFGLIHLLNYRIGSDIETLLLDNEIKNNILNATPVSEVAEMEENSNYCDLLIEQRSVDTLQSFLEAGQSDKYFRKLAELIYPLKLFKNKNNRTAIEAYYKVALCLLSHINQCKLADKIAFHLNLNKLMQIDKYGSWEEAVEYIYKLSNIIFQCQSDEQKKRAKNVINFIQQFIGDHLGEDLSLVRLAEQVYMNPSYLSRLYKQETNTNLSDFIASVRIKKAKELLMQENVIIHEVGKTVGYETAASFTRFFRKMSCCSPQEYHEKHLFDNHV